MLEQQATVVSIDSQNEVWVLAARQSPCGSCQESAQCHSSSVVTAPSLAIKVKKNGYILQVGDDVMIEIAERILWYGLVYLYVYPLAAMMLGAIIGQLCLGEWAAILMASLCFIVALMHVKHLTQPQNDNYLPTVIKKLKYP